jgi:hypothetical protein
VKLAQRRAPSPWLTRWTLVFFAGSAAVAASCGSGSSTNPSQTSSGGQASVGSGGVAATAGGTLSGSGGDPESAGQTSGAAGEAGETGSAGASSGSSGSAGGGSIPDAGRSYPDVTFTYDAGPSTTLTPDAACASSAVETLPIPLDMYVVLDRSGSMNLPQALPVGNTTPGAGDCNVGDATASRWCYSINALDKFFGSSAAAGTQMALQFFPAGGCTTSPSPLLFGCCSSGACCKGALEAQPDVIGTLPESRQSFVAALNAATPWADRTPIEAALRGIIQYTKTAARPGRQMMGLLITDGGPEGCQSSAASLAALISAHLSATGVPIYIVGTQGAAYSWLESLAAVGGAPLHDQRCAGGVKPCHFYDVGSGKPAVFIEVLQQIQRAAIACTFAMPTTDAGLADPSEVALALTPSGSSSAARVPQVTTLADCGSADGFYYDDNGSPNVISLCPSSCDALRAGDGGKVELLLGCKGS